jgi:hypothetical protein
MNARCVGALNACAITVMESPCAKCARFLVPVGWEHCERCREEQGRAAGGLDRRVHRIEDLVARLLVALARGGTL